MISGNVVIPNTVERERGLPRVSVIQRGRRMVDSRMLVKRRKEGLQGRRLSHASAVERMYLSVEVSLLSSRQQITRTHRPGGVVILGSHRRNSPRQYCCAWGI